MGRWRGEKGGRKKEKKPAENVGIFESAALIFSEMMGIDGNDGMMESRDARPASWRHSPLVTPVPPPGTGSVPVPRVSPLSGPFLCPGRAEGTWGWVEK